ncbi:MAG: flavin reductase, partial [Spirochaetales bacterium]|nr:flavin reductase [Spirochaetales bacterium]
WNEDGTANAMNAAWGGVSNDHEFTLCLSANHKTVRNLQRTGAFTISMGDAAHVAACDYVGLASGNRDADKLSKAGFTVSKSEFVNAPVINELAVCVECNVISYDEKTCVLVGDIVNVSVSESAMTDGKVDIRKVRPIVFDPFNADYLEIGEKVGKAFSDGKSLMKK